MDRHHIGVLCATAAGGVERSILPTRLGLADETLNGVVETLIDRELLDTIDGVIECSPRLTYDVETLTSLLPMGYEVTWYDTLASTNEHARELLEPGDADRLLVIAERQTAGRGRRGRQWSSPTGGIWASVGDGRHLPVDTAWIEQLAMAVAVADATHTLGVDSAIKWPNDVNDAHGRKLAGILLNTRSAGDTRTRTICGVGINANVDASTLPEGSMSLQTLAGPIRRAPFLAHVIHTFEQLRTDPASTLAMWSSHSETVGRTVRVETPDGSHTGIAKGLDDAGALVIETRQGTQTISLGHCERLRYVQPSR